MIIEDGVNPSFLDISQFPTADFSHHIAFVDSISTEFRKATNQPFLKINLTDVNGRKLIGYIWNVEASAQTSFSWAISHLVHIEYSCISEQGNKICINTVSPLGDQHNEPEILKTMFLKKLDNLDNHVALTKDMYNRLLSNFPEYKYVFTALLNKGSMQELRFSRDPEICAGAAGGRVDLIFCFGNSIASGLNILSLSQKDKLTVLMCEYIYEYLCAKYKPASLIESPTWRMDCILELSTLLGGFGPEVPEELTTTLADLVMELLGVSDIRSKLGSTIQILRDALVKISSLTYKLDEQVGDSIIYLNGDPYIR